jgi:hypothetical protein
MARCWTSTTPTIRPARTAAATGCRCCHARTTSACGSASGRTSWTGIAGESVLLETPVAWGPEALAGPLELETADGGRLALDRAAVAAPCVEFSRILPRPRAGRS